MYYQVLTFYAEVKVSLWVIYTHLMKGNENFYFVTRKSHNKTRQLWITGASRIYDNVSGQVSMKIGIPLP